MKNISTLFSRFGFRYGARLHPVRDWLVILAVFTLLLLVSLFWNIWLFTQATNGMVLGSSQAPEQAQVQLDQVKGLFDSRAAQQARYLQEYHFVDPSL